MNLRTFHFLLILISALLAVVLGGWLLRVHGGQRGLITVMGAVLCFAVAVGLVLYDRWFLRKTRTFK